jgi:ABC-2 type transport system ATP-binding protein
MLLKLDLEPAALKKPVRNYSKGMTQKIGLAGCFLSGKKMLILDEPMSGLDPKARALVKNLFSELKNTHTIFFTSHSLNDIEEICDRMAVLHNGQIYYVGTPEKLRVSYGNKTLEHAFLNCINQIKS